MIGPLDRSARDRGSRRCEILLAAALLTMSSAPLAGQSPASSAILPPLADGTVALVGVRVIAMRATAGTATAPMTLVIRDGLIAGIGPPETIEIPPDAEVIEAEGGYVIPGLIDMHVHLRDSDIEEYLLNGVTTVRNMWGTPEVHELRQRVAGGAPLPAIASAGPGIDGNPPVWPGSAVLVDAGEAATAVARQVDQGWDFIKTYNRLTPDVYVAVLAAARAEGIPVIGHVPLAADLEQALAGGHTSFEHFTGIADALAGGRGPAGWTSLDRGAVEGVAHALARHDAWVCPTQVILSNLGRNTLDDEAASRARRNQAFVVKALHDAGVGLLAGTDAGLVDEVPAGSALITELELFAGAGLTPYEALLTATVGPATFLGIDGSVGTVEIGKRADLLLLAGDPLDDLSVLREPVAVILRGRIVAETGPALP